ncbi:MAG TPA: DciA family protein [Vicinamibacterales bacterium]|nr:DciA family protein [Vicinamibacterales bacterium]
MIRADRVIPVVLAEVISKAPLCDEKVDFAWRASVGAAVVKMTTVKLDDAGVLHVDAADAHWAREVRRSARLILARLEPLLGHGTVKRITTNK